MPVAMSMWGIRTTTRFARSARPVWSPPWRVPPPSAQPMAAARRPVFMAPLGVVTDASGNVYVADYGNNEIRKITQ
ncbi:hypothetical protein [Halothiobacillus sp.]|uniref:hypothetical protein n=1 Tax=Halothiobacillus sp. TaxID=1891311 RepID=UPI003452979C